MRACVFAVVASAAITAIGAPTAAGAEHDFGTITPTATGAAITVSTTAAGDTARVSFEGQANQRVHLKLGPINCGAVACADVYIKRASGANHTSKYVGKDGAYIETTLPATETYSIVVDPRSTYVVSESMTVYDVPPDVTGPISADGGTAYVTTTTPGQRAVFNFSASPSQRVSLQIGGIPSCNGACADVYLKSSSGDVLGSAYVQDTGAWIDTKELTAGTHTVEVDPRGSWTISNLALTVYTVPPDPVVPMLIGSTASAATSTPGQNATFRFTALAGSTVKVTANGSPCTGACADISVRPWGSGTVIAGPQYVSSTGATLSSVALNQTGEYYVKFDPRGSRTMMATVTVSQTGGPSIQDLLERHLPIWKYDSGERFHILSPGALTDFYTGDSFASSNALKDANGAFALANQTFGTYPNGVLRLSYLQSMYPTDTSRRAGTAAETSDNVSARGNNDDGFYEGDAQEMEGRSNYPYKVYARPAFGSDGKLWLQYWVFYYFNPDPASPLGDVHEGDWEMIQVGLNADRTPEDAVYAQHDSGQKCAWPSVERAGDSPVVYVGEHSHASYFGPDRIPAAYLYDHADGGGGGLFAGEVRQIGSNDPPWMAWNGHWGDSGKSPQGPQYQPPENRWRDPSAWPANPTPCL